MPRGRLRPGARVGRFSVLGGAGDGRDADAYEAYDSQLDRRVTLKMLGTPEPELVKKIQALAQLEHPNVVAVHDVGEHHGVLFVAMAFVNGDSFQRTALVGNEARILAWIVGAGRGLAAMHGAGLVHRGFGPHSIRVDDAGLARVAGFDNALTEGGQLTERKEAAPQVYAYASPEALSGEGQGAASDQFSYCAVAWERLFGVLPFHGESPAALLQEIRRAPPRLREGGAFSHEIEPLLLRGLACLPAERYERLALLVDALDEVSSRLRGRRRSAKRWAGALLGTAAVAVAGAYSVGRVDPHCGDGMPDFRTVWTDKERLHLRSAFGDSQLGYAQAALDNLEPRLDGYAAEWAASRDEACATTARGEQSAARMDARAACLHDAAQAFSASLELAQTGEPPVIANAHALVRGLPDVRHCASARGVPTPAEVATLRSVATARALRSIGRGDDARALAEVAVRDGEGGTPIVRAKALLEYGMGLAELDPRRGIDAASEAFSVARAAGLSHVAASAAREVAKMHVLAVADPGEIRTWLQLADGEGVELFPGARSDRDWVEAQLLRLEGQGSESLALLERQAQALEHRPELQAEALRQLAIELSRQKRSSRAIEVGRRALSEHLRAFGEHPGAARFERALARILTDAEQWDEAKVLAGRATSHARELWGEGHPKLGRFLGEQARVACARNRHDEEALRLAKSALELEPGAPPSLGRRHALDTVRFCAASQDASLAARISTELVALTERLYGSRHHFAVFERARLASLLLEAGQQTAAREQLWIASPLAKERLPGWESTRALEVHRWISETASILAEQEVGAEHAEAAVRIVDADLSVDDSARALAHSLLCRSKLAGGELETALSQCREALSGPPERGTSFFAELEYRTGFILYYLQRDAEALPHAEAAVRLLQGSKSGPGSRWLGHAYAKLGLIHERLGDDRAAEESFQASFELLSGAASGRGDLFVAGAGLVRTAVRSGRMTQAQKLLKTLEGHSPNLFEVSVLLEARGFVLHSADPQAGASEYAQAFDYLRGVGRSYELDRFCNDAPFELSGCGPAGSDPL